MSRNEVDINQYAVSYVDKEGSGGRKKRKKNSGSKGLIVFLVIVVLAALAGVAIVMLMPKQTGVVTGTEIEGFTDTAVTLKWEKSDGAKSYRVYQCQKGQSDYVVVKDELTEPTFTLNGLAPATWYSFGIKAVSDGGKVSDNFEKTVSVTTKPEAIEITSIVSRNDGEIYLEWSDSPKATGYLIEYKTAGNDYNEANSLSVKKGVKNGKDVKNLEPGAELTVRVSAYIDVDQGDAAYPRAVGIPSAEKTISVAGNGVKPTSTDTSTPDPDKPATQSDKPINNVDPNKPMVALTFDDGPLGGQSSEKILDVLEKYNAKATFFMIGNGSEEHPDNLKRKVQLGMELGNHTYDHENYGDDVTAETIKKASDAIFSASGQYPTCFRSPGGMTTDTILAECKKEGMAAYYWSLDTEDWKSRDADTVYNAVMSRVEDGDIILMHEIYDSTADAVEKMVPALIEKGYQLVTCHDLIAAKTGAAPVAGKEYINAWSDND